MKMVDIDSGKLIKAMKMRPALYNRNDKFYRDHIYKEKIWRKVSEEVHGNWNQLSQLDKVEYVRKIQKRWKCVRTAFANELRKQKQENIKQETDQHVKKRKRYEYFDNLLFLMDTTNGDDETRESDDSADPFDSSYQPEEMISNYGEPASDVKNVRVVKIETIPEQNYTEPQVVRERNNTLEEKVVDMLKDIKKDENDENRPADDGDETKDREDSADHFDSSYQPEETISDYGELSRDVKNVHTMNMETIPEQNYPKPQAVYERNNTLEEKVLDMLKDIKKNEDDEDRQFLLSLVPTFKKLNTKQKLTARIEILKVLHNISFEQN